MVEQEITGFPGTGRALRRLVPSHVTGFIGAVIGYILASSITHIFTIQDVNPNGPFPVAAEQELLMGFVGLLLGWLIGVGAFGLPVRWVFGQPNLTHEEEMAYTRPGEGIWRYFRWNTDHKVIGIQYLVLVLIMLAEGGLIAMLMRANLMFPGSRLVPTETYNTFVSMHGMIMIATMFTTVVGPFGNFILPIMIGARDMAFPRLNALSWHVLAAGFVIFNFIPFVDGVQTGWTFYSPLSDQTGRGADAFAFGVMLIMVSSALGAINIITTIITMRAPGMRWTRLPIFVWAILGSTILTATATTSVITDLIEIMTDRAWNTTFFLNTVPANFVIGAAPDPAGGGQAYLSEVLFWFFGHPEVYLLALPGFGVVLEIVPVFSRKPLFTYGLSLVGILGVTAISFLVWGHHLFVSGWEAQLRGYYMGTTELISIPTGFVFLGILGTVWRGKIWMKIPMAWVFAFLWTFVIGGLTGIYLSDVPADIQLHGNYFVVAHFHFVILGSALWGFFAAVYYWFPKMTGRFMDERLGWIHFWGVQIAFNITFLVFFYLGFQGLPRRVADYAPIFDFGNTLASVFAFILGAFMLVFFANVIWSWKYGVIAPANPWAAKTLEWQVPTPVPIENFEEIPVVVSGPYDYGEPEAAPSQERPTAEPAAGM
ncbi:MAG: cytochrome c oxidase subunit I [Ktedonobacterales bacterium]